MTPGVDSLTHQTSANRRNCWPEAEKDGLAHPRGIEAPAIEEKSFLLMSADARDKLVADRTGLVQARLFIKRSDPAIPGELPSAHKGNRYPVDAK